MQIIKWWKIIRSNILNLIYVLLDFIDILIHAKTLSDLLQKMPNTEYLFITDRYIPRVDKIAFAIHSLGERSIVLIVRKRKFPFSELYKTQLSVHSIYKTFWIIKRLKPKIIHVFSSWNFDLAYGLIRKKNLLSAKVIFDDYDVLAGMLNERLSSIYFKKQVQIEKYCLENADGLCCRSLETQFAKRKLKYNLKAKRIFFPEYMWNRPVNNKSEFSKHLVYIGNFNSNIAELADKIAPSGWKLDIYAGHQAITSISYVPSNLIIHNALAPLDLIKTLQNYQVAIQLPVIMHDPTKSIFTVDKYNYAAAGKIFDYVESGLKVFIADEIFQRWILWRYGAAIEIDSIDTMEDIVRKLSNFELPISNAGFSANHLTLKEQAPRLEKFYNSILTEE